MNDEKIIVAADLGSSQIKLIAAKKLISNPQIEILTAQTAESKYVHKGLIAQPTELAYKLREISRLVNNTIGSNCDIHSMYVSLQDISIRSLKQNYVKTYGTTIRLTHNDLKTLKNEAVKSFLEEEDDVISVVPQYYVVDGERETDPQGLKCSQIEVEYLVVYCNKSTKNSISKLFERTDKIDLLDISFAIEGAANRLLTVKQKNDGVTLIDFGASTTSLAVYKDGVLSHVAVLPFGGDNITRDIATEFAIDRSIAENLKKSKVAAVADESKQNVTFSFKAKNQDYSVPYSTLYDVLKARLDEILALCKNEIEKVCPIGELKAGLVIFGGAANLSAINEYLSQYFDIHVSNAKYNSETILSGVEISENFAALVDIALNANTSCATIKNIDPEDEIEPVTQPKSAKPSATSKSPKSGRFGWIGDLFDDKNTF